MDKYIKQLLSDDSRVIIPNFGCIQASRDESQLLIFNRYLNFDDGKLVNAIMADKDISEDDAKSLIASSVNDYNNALQNGQTVTINGVCTFYRDENGNIDILHPGDTVPTPEPEPQATPEPEPEPTPAPEPEPTTNTNPSPAPTTRTIPSYLQKDNSHKPLIVTLIILLLLLIIWLLLFVFFKNNPVYKLFFPPQKVEAPAPAPAPVPADTIKVEVPTPEPPKVEEPEPEPTTTAQPLKKRYNIIVGSYRDEPAATKRVEDLHAKGFTDAFVATRRGHFVAVLAEFNSIAEAESMQEQAVESQYHIESWITNSGE